MIEVECIDPSGYEWILQKGFKYELVSWTNDTLVIMHPKCGIYGFYSNRFKVLNYIELINNSAKNKTLWTPDIGRKNQSLLIKMMRDRQGNPKCLICKDEGYVEQGSGPLGGFVECGCQEEG